MAATTAITAIRTAHGGKFVPHKMLAARSSMTTAAEYADLVHKIAFLQIGKF